MATATTNVGPEQIDADDTQPAGNPSDVSMTGQTFADLARRCEELGVLDRLDPSIDDALRAIDGARKTPQSRCMTARQILVVVLAMAQDTVPLVGVADAAAVPIAPARWRMLEEASPAAVAEDVAGMLAEDVAGMLVATGRWVETALVRAAAALAAAEVHGKLRPMPQDVEGLPP